MIPDELLEEFIFGFYGYGKPHARYWFIGMEEAIRESSPQGIEKKFAERLRVWEKRGKQEWEDLRGFHRVLNEDWFESAPYVPTWRRIIRVLSWIQKGQKPNKHEIKEYQRTRLGRKRGDTYLVELLPLPSRGVNDWPWKNYSRSLPYLKTRADYEKHVKPKRVAYLKAKIEEHPPAVVVFYGKRYKKEWNEIAGTKLHFNREGIKVASNGDTLFVLMKHPSEHGVENHYFDRIGRMLWRHVDRS